ncbi:Hypothetical protein SMAX5B_011229 [Scophthalmus maximus]|uniref:Uncharacterized protein n=1 Tax=Scophthalmus maximus TaxID=52904 RepID=A0A2U9CU16_SCOMX|nr:Hypothetical protein SMAX5B_011229 [Scophthalmus maximus]
MTPSPSPSPVRTSFTSKTLTSSHLRLALDMIYVPVLEDCSWKVDSYFEIFRRYAPLE